ncbi:aminotransferase class V-fold PLP-dependent enzyme [Candidatus Saccharibacteria bacterium]|nr:aminotransferase class V-fold PLP-dependent enzyme [Candidatus Saccharibacteria bacterium]
MTEREVERLRGDFPLINRGGVVYFDNAATMQKPQCVIDRVRKFYEEENANPLRGLYDLSVQAEEQVEAVRAKVAKLMGAERTEEIIFTKNATEAINWTAAMLGKKLAMDDEVVVSLRAHHSNFLPWLDMRAKYKVGMSFVRVIDKAKTTPNTKLVVLPGMSNVTGEEEVVKRREGMIYSVDLAQTIAHRQVDVVKEKVDFAQWSGHKIGAPMGVGVLYGRREFLGSLQPAEIGGGMVSLVNFGKQNLHVEFVDAPQKFEAGTLNVEGILGLGAAIDYWQERGPEKLFAYVNDLTEYAKEKLVAIKELELVAAGNGIISFKISGVHPHDVAQVLAEEGICVRAGYHCAQPLLDTVLEVGPVVRASLAFYNTRAEVDKMVAVLKTVRSKMGL